MAELTDLPELFDSRALPGGDPFADAISQAESGCEAGLLCYDPESTNINAALVLAPEVVLSGAMAMIPLCTVAFHEAAAPLVGTEDDIRLDWNGGIRFGDELRGQVRLATPGNVPDKVPDWLVVGLTINFEKRPGAVFPDPFEEIAPNFLLEHWAKKIFDGIGEWSENGPKTLGKKWRKLSRERGKKVELCGRRGRMKSISDEFSLQLTSRKNKSEVAIIELLEPTQD